MMKNYLTMYSSIQGKWTVFNKELNKVHSFWASQRQASQAANDLNKYLRNIEFNKRLEQLSLAKIRK